MTQDEFRWQAFFQRTREPLFVLSRQRRLLFVNRAWENVTGVPAAEARGQRVSQRRKSAGLDLWEALAHALAPPVEVFEGQCSRVRRQAPPTLPHARGEGREVGRWWDVEFFPLESEKGLLGVLGKIRVVAAAEPVR